MNDLATFAKKLGADSAAIMVPDSVRGYNYCLESYNMPDEWVAIKNSFDETTPGGNVQVYKTGKSAISNNVSISLKGHHLESVMIVPVFKNGKVAAVLEFVRSNTKIGFSQENLKIAEESAKQVIIVTNLGS